MLRYFRSTPVHLYVYLTLCRSMALLNSNTTCFIVNKHPDFLLHVGLQYCIPVKKTTHWLIVGTAKGLHYIIISLCFEDLQTSFFQLRDDCRKSAPIKKLADQNKTLDDLILFMTVNSSLTLQKIHFLNVELDTFFFLNHGQSPLVLLQLRRWSSLIM